MPRAKQRATRTSGSSRTRGGRGQDAIALLKADHREVESLHSQFEKARSDDRKAEIAGKICTALKTHTRIEEEIFYPAFIEATQDTETHHEAEIEHEGVSRLIAEIEASSPDDEYYEAKMTVMMEMVKHHVKEEEQRGGMFAKAKQSDMDLKELGEQLQARKKELQNGAAPNRRPLGSRVGALLGH